MRTANFLYELNRDQNGGTLLNIDQEQSPVVICAYKIRKRRMAVSSRILFLITA